VTVTIAGAGGCGINLARPFLNKDRKDTDPVNVLYFDTSTTNSRYQEKVNVLASGSGSGSNRKEHARDIERVISQMSDEEIGKADVAIVISSLQGGSGSIISPILAREYHRRGMRVIVVAITDTSYSVGANNCLNTLKTFEAICRNNNLYLPAIILSNDAAQSRGPVDRAAFEAIANLLGLLTTPVYEVDRNDRLNWINPTKVVNSEPGLKILSAISHKDTDHGAVLLGFDSQEMVDSLLILQAHGDESTVFQTPPARLKKTGFYYKDDVKPILGKVTSDVSSIDKIIDYVERMNHQDKSQKHQSNSRLSTSGSDDLIL
jgi:hypothetical protein